ncbi:hypothetical protein ACHAWF_004288 [Thalassiosira exigua]
MMISYADESCDESTKEYSLHFDPTITRYSDDDAATPPTLNNADSTPESNEIQQHHHGEALLLSLAFFFVWTPQNLLAPNLTQAAHDFGYEDDRDRDLYLGSNLALASSVLSLPFSALIGFASDAVSRRTLISITTFIGGMAAVGTGMTTNYLILVLCRFIGGSCWTGSVPVVFSLLSDWFHDKDRAAASSAFTSMMGAGIISGQIFAGYTGPTSGWRHSFYVSGLCTMVVAVLLMICISEPVRGGKEKALKEMLESGGKYERKLSFWQFVSSITNNSSNCILILQGFFSSIPFGVLFVFINDFLSQEKGLSVQDATFIVAVFGVGCAVGGILGGFVGALASQADRRYLPLFMAMSTFLGIIPFIALLDDTSYDSASVVPCFYAFAAGCLISLSSVNVRPCIINVNPPEIRGATLTTANLIINAARGVGPSFLTTLVGFGFSRSHGFNILIITFWTMSAIQLALLAKTLPADQDRMEAELATYASSSLDIGQYGSIADTGRSDKSYSEDVDGDLSLFNIENQASSFDAIAARQSLVFLGDSLREIGDDLSCTGATCGRRHELAKEPVLTDFSR